MNSVTEPSLEMGTTVHINTLQLRMILFYVLSEAIFTL